MNNQPIGFIDSGVGGLPYLSWAQSHLPKEFLVYLADRENFPYGDKFPHQVIKAIVNGVEKLIEKENPKLMVIACNTATVLTLKHLRSLFRIPFVGVVPAIKPAAERSQDKRIGVLATARTVSDQYLQNLIDQFASGCTVEKRAGGDIVTFVEYNLNTSTLPEKKAIVKGPIQRFLDLKVDSIVLGCTHFLFLINEINSFIHDGIEVIDSREGVGNQIIHVLRENNLLANEKKQHDKMYFTGNWEIENRYYWFAHRFHLNIEGSL